MCIIHISHTITDCFAFEDSFYNLIYQNHYLVRRILIIYDLTKLIKNSKRELQ